MWYQADIGTYERGVVFRFKERNDKAAMRRASRKGNLVQIFRSRVKNPKPKDCILVWDEYGYGQ
jgi:hypothetical protein